MSCYGSNNKPWRWNWTRWPLLAESHEAPYPRLTRDPQHWISSKLKMCTARWGTLSKTPRISDSWNILCFLSRAFAQHTPQNLSTWCESVSEICSWWPSRKFSMKKILLANILHIFHAKTVNRDPLKGYELWTIIAQAAKITYPKSFSGFRILVLILGPFAALLILFILKFGVFQPRFFQVQLV